MDVFKNWILGNKLDSKPIARIRLELLYKIGIGLTLVILLPIPVFYKYISPMQLFATGFGALGGILTLLSLKIWKSASKSALTYIFLGIFSNSLCLIAYANCKLELTIGIWFVIHILVAFFTLGKKFGIWSMFITLVICLAIVGFESLPIIQPLKGHLPSTKYDEVFSMFLGFIFVSLLIDAFLKEQAQRKNELVSSNDRLKLLAEIFNHTKENIQIINSEGRFVYANNASLISLGVSNGDLLNKSVFDLLPDYKNNPNLWETVFSELRANGSSYRERDIKTHDGKHFNTEVSSNYIQFEGKEYLLAFVRDIGELKKLKLEKNEAELKSKLKADFLSNMSHEIRTPMNAIIGLSNLMAKVGALNEKQKHYLELIQLNSKNLLGIINDILDISKIEAGKIHLEIRPFNLKENIAACCESLSASLETKGLDFSITFDELCPTWVVGDSMRIGQVITNLISNAGKFTIQGGVYLRIRRVNQTMEKVTLRFEVIDTGIGIAKEKQAQIFNSFEQAQSHTTREFGGTGLGLSIVKKLLEIQGSHIQIESELGKGSMFWFDIELGNPKTEDLPEEWMKRDKIGSGENKEHLKGINNIISGETSELRILIADDNGFNQIVAMDSIKEWYPNANFDLVEDGEMAVEMAIKNKYSLILMDIQMPKMNGLQAAQAIRKLEKLESQTVPILGLTAENSGEETLKCMEAGMNECLPKPFQLEDFEAKVRFYLTKVEGKA